jgi:hypothetical protein
MRFVSRKNRTLIHFVPAKAPPGRYVLQQFHQSVRIPRVSALCRKLFEPPPEHRRKPLMLGLGQQTRLPE